MFARGVLRVADVAFGAEREGGCDGAVAGWKTVAISGGIGKYGERGGRTEERDEGGARLLGENAAGEEVWEGVGGHR